ncbi:outer membrane protein OmpK [Dongshaea marina]|uniref:outer membrane protein OmpK n=1 Tax=Dongshaea marina TaxID=2047966 RepID=UPI000D3E09A4|nr:outer membrane protein OmpK [Dongshaea marina]
MKKVLALSVLTAAMASATASAATTTKTEAPAPAKAQQQATTDIHANDYQWMNLKLMRNQNNKPGSGKDTYGELEFGGQSGALDFYGYADLLDILNDSKSTAHDGQDSVFVKLLPRLSIDKLTGKDLSVGPIKEWFLFGLINAQSTTWNNYYGLGVNLDVPGMDVFKINTGFRQVRKDQFTPAAEGWNGYYVGGNWFKKFAEQKNGNYFDFHGYFDYDFGQSDFSNNYSFAILNGMSYNMGKWFVAVDFKYYNNVYNIKDNATGWGQYYTIGYKF